MTELETKRPAPGPPDRPQDINARVTVVPEGSAKKPPSLLDLYKATVDLVKAVAWPLLLLVFFLAFREPLTRSIKLLPDKLSEATKLSVGSLTLEIEKKAREIGTVDLAESLGKLSPKAVDELLNTGKKTYHALVGEGPDEGEYSMPSQERMKVLLELYDRGFLAFSDDPREFGKFFDDLPFEEDHDALGERKVYRPTRDLSVEEARRLREQQFFLTSEGEIALDAVVAAVVEQLKQVDVT